MVEKGAKWKHVETMDVRLRLRLYLSRTHGKIAIEYDDKVVAFVHHDRKNKVKTLWDIYRLFKEE